MANVGKANSNYGKHKSGQVYIDPVTVRPKLEKAYLHVVNETGIKPKYGEVVDKALDAYFEKHHIK